jgi:predicted nucleotidyltransferase
LGEQPILNTIGYADGNRLAARVAEGLERTMYRLHEEKDRLSDPVRALVMCCAEAVHRDDPGARVILYGSQARGEATLESDVDLLIVLECDIPAQEHVGIHDRLYEVGLQRDAAISTMISSVSRGGRPIWRQHQSTKPSRVKGCSGHDGGQRDLVRYRMERAVEALHEACLMLQAGHHAQ